MPPFSFKRIFPSQCNQYSNSLLLYGFRIHFIQRGLFKSRRTWQLRYPIPEFDFTCPPEFYDQTCLLGLNFVLSLTKLITNINYPPGWPVVYSSILFMLFHNSISRCHSQGALIYLCFCYCFIFGVVCLMFWSQCHRSQFQYHRHQKVYRLMVMILSLHQTLTY